MKHILVDIYGCDKHACNDLPTIKDMIAACVRMTGTTLINMLHQEGITCLALLKEGHIAVHTWPETGYVALDVFTCKDDIDIFELGDIAKRYMLAGTAKSKVITRHMLDG